MTFGQKIVLGAPFTDTSLPKLPDDPRLNAGSLCLIDPAHPANPWPSGVDNLIDGATVPNLAWKEAAALIGSGSQSSLAASVTKPSQFTSSVGILERSAKGGLHVIMSASTAVGTGKGMGIRPSQAVADWIVAHPTHKYLISMWLKVTRFGNENGAPIGFSLNASPSADARALASIGGDNNNRPTGATRMGQRRTRTEWRVSSDATLTPPFADAIFADIAVDGYTGTPDVSGSAALAVMKMFSAGAIDPFKSTVAGYRSELLWSAYIEDLTVSGLNYAQADAIGYAEFQKQILTPGGRYYGDTHTTPALA